MFFVFFVFFLSSEDIFLYFCRCAIIFCSSLCFSIELVQSWAIVSHDPGDWAKILMLVTETSGRWLFIGFFKSTFIVVTSIMAKIY